MTDKIPHQASYTTPAFDFPKYLRDQLQNKRDVRRGQVAEIERLEKALIGVDAQIVEIEAAITKMEAP